MRLWNLYYYLLQYSAVLPLAFAYRCRRTLDAPLRLFVGYLLTSLALTAIMTVMAKNAIQNLWVMNLSFPLYACWILAAFSLWERDPKCRLAMRAAIPFFALVWGTEMALRGVFFEFTTFARPLLSVLFIAASLRTIYEGNRDVDDPLLDQPRFWISAGVLFYYGGMLGINVTSQTLLKNAPQGLATVIMLQPAINFAAHCFYAQGFRLQCRR